MAQNVTVVIESQTNKQTKTKNVEWIRRKVAAMTHTHTHKHYNNSVYKKNQQIFFLKTL